MSKKDESHNIEFLESLLRDWAENMWKDNNKDKFPDEEASRKAFWGKWFPNNNRGLSKTQSFSEQGFSLYIHAAVYSVGLVSDRALEALADNRLVNAWRKSVQKNSFQQKYSALEEILKENIDKHGKGAAAAHFPDLKDVSIPEEIAKALEYMNYNATQYPVSTVAGLIRQSNRSPEAVKQSPNGPKAG